MCPRRVSRRGPCAALEAPKLKGGIFSFRKEDYFQLVSVKATHTGERDAPLWFVTFTCYEWINLFHLSNTYSVVYSWFEYLRENQIAHTIAYVIMPNHVHAILNLSENNVLNKVLSNGKRFMAYEIVSTLNKQNQVDLLFRLSSATTSVERKRGQKHKVFEPSFDAKEVLNEKFLYQKLDYIHNNPVSKKWMLAQSPVDYAHSSAAWYETGTGLHFKPTHYRDVF